MSNRLTWWEALQFKFWLWFYLWEAGLPLLSAYEYAKATWPEYLDGSLADELFQAIFETDPIYTIRTYAESCVEEERGCWDGE